MKGKVTTLKARIVLALALALVFAGSACKKKTADAEDPLKQIAKQRYAEGRRLFLTGDPANYPQALKAFDDALSSWEEYPEALAAWAETISMWYGFRMSRTIFEQAYVRAQRAIRLAPESDMGYRAMADLFRHYRNPETGKLSTEEALKTIERAVALNPKSAENLYVKGSIYLATDPDRALEILKQALFLNPDLCKVYFNLGSAYQIKGDSIFLAQPDPDPAVRVQNEKDMHGYFKQAADNLLIYQRLVPGDLGGYASLGIVYLHDGNYARAEEMFQKTISVNQSPDPSLMQWRELAYIYLAQLADEQKKDLNLSRSYLEKALEANPYDTQVYAQLIRIAKLQNDDAGAKKYEDMFQAMLAKVKAQTEAQAGATAEPEPGATAAPTPGGTVPAAPLPAAPAPAGGATP